MPLTPDDLVAGRYRVVGLLGRGGTAEVHRARDERLGRDVALKVLAHHLVDDVAAARRLRREAASIAALNHPNVVTLHDVVDTRDELVLVMELVEGRTLADLLRTDGALSVRAAATVAGGVAVGLAAAHDRDIVHRDVKPANVLVTADGRVKVADFGIAGATVVSSSATTSIMGTLAYVAPEQAGGAPADPRSDLYALGCVLVEMLTGRPPFTGPTPAAVLAQHLGAVPPVPSERRPGLPPTLDPLVASLLAKDPADRPRSAGEVATALAAVAGTDAATAPVVAVRSGPAAAGRVDASGAPTTRVPVGGAAVTTTPGTAVLPTAGPTGGSGTATSGGPPRQRGRWAGGALVALVAVAAIALGFTRATGDTPGPATDDSPAASSAPPASPSPTATASTAAPEQPTAAASPTLAPAPVPTPTPARAPATVAEAVAALRADLAAGLGEGLVGRDAADRIEDRIDELVRKVAGAVEKDDPRTLANEARKRTTALRDELGKRVDEGAVDRRLARRLGAGIDVLAGILGVADDDAADDSSADEDDR